MSKKMKNRCLILIGVTFLMMVLAMITDRIFTQPQEGVIIQMLTQRAWVPFILTVVALICAFIYVSKDAKKEAAIYHKVFAGSFLVTYIYFFHMLIVLLPLVKGNQQAIVHLFILDLLVSYSAILILTFAPNLGKRYSLILASIAVIADFIIFMISVIEGVSPGVVCSFIANILMIAIFYLMIEAKYMDKDARGTI